MGTRCVVLSKIVALFLEHGNPNRYVNIWFVRSSLLWKNAPHDIQVYSIVVGVSIIEVDSSEHAKGLPLVKTMNSIGNIGGFLIVTLVTSYTSWNAGTAGSFKSGRLVTSKNVQGNTSLMCITPKTVTVVFFQNISGSAPLLLISKYVLSSMWTINIGGDSSRNAWLSNFNHHLMGMAVDYMTRLRHFVPPPQWVHVCAFGLLQFLISNEMIQRQFW